MTSFAELQLLKALLLQGFDAPTTGGRTGFHELVAPSPMHPVLLQPMVPKENQS